MAASIARRSWSWKASTKPPDIAAVVAKTTELVIQQTIDIPRILVVPKGEVQIRLQAVHAGTRHAQLSSRLPRSSGFSICAPTSTEVVGLGKGGIEEARLEDYVVSGLVDFDDVSYDDHADLLYDLAARPCGTSGPISPKTTRGRCCGCYQREIARFIHAQMQEHYWEEAVGYEVKVSKGFTELKPSAYTAVARPTARFPSVAGRQEQHGEVPVRRLQAVPLSGAEVPVRRRAQARGHPRREAREVVQAGQGAVSDLLQVRRRSPGVPARLRRRDRRTRSTCWSRRRGIRWTMPTCSRRRTPP